LEDRIVKRFLRDQSKPIEQPLEIPLQKENLGIKLKLIGKKVRPSEKEVSNNPRSRSALLRVAERC
jgi:Predicted S-adenosylmethionine-dependent methyltransferase involved in cell envelope biogenesis